MEISGCQNINGRWEDVAIKGKQEGLSDNGMALYLDCGGGFINVHVL